MTDNNTVRENLHQTALKAPTSSGVYLWKNSQDKVIYVGKARNLKNRLSSYFSKNKDLKTKLLVSGASFIEYITTSNEYEAFLLENNLIKKYSPKYNINLKDGKSYPVLRITNEDFPRMFKTRNVVHDGSKYFGPYPDAGALDTFIETLYSIYPIRRCKVLKKKDSPCLYYHIGQCKAPCCSKISKESYNEFFGEISRLLEGKGEEALSKIKAEMLESSKALNFEKAARLRDGLRALSVMQNQNIVENFNLTDRDYIAYFREGELVSFTVLKMRGGKLIAKDNYRTVSLNEDEELIPEFFNAFYTEKEEVPPAIYIPFFTRDIEKQDNDTISEKNQFLSAEDLENWFNQIFTVKTKIIAVNKMVEEFHHAAMNMAFQNAKEDIVRRKRERGDFPALEELREILGLEKTPVRIEGFDIAHIGGKFPVASLISFYNGNPDKKNYRYFRLRTTDGYIDDFQSMREAAARRYTRLLNEQADLPDLILIDGGIGQVNAVKNILDSLHLNIPIAGLAKRDEEIWLPNASKPICLPKRSDALRLLQRVRDETHRFATSRNQKLRTKENTVSIFIKLPGIGEKLALKLTKKFPTIEDLANSTESIVSDVLNISEARAKELLIKAQELLSEQIAKKQNAMQSLKTAGTTVQNAASAQYIKNLATQMLEIAEQK